MTSAQLYYLLNLLIYAGVDIIACLGLSQQFGVAGVTNFGFIIFQAAGTYTAAGAAVLIVEQRARAVLAISDYTYVLGGGQVLMADTPAHLNASQEFTESFFGVGPKIPQAPQAPKPS